MHPAPVSETSDLARRRHSLSTTTKAYKDGSLRDKRRGSKAIKDLRSRLDAVVAELIRMRVENSALRQALRQCQTKDREDGAKEEAGAGGGDDKADRASEGGSPHNIFGFLDNEDGQEETFRSDQVFSNLQEQQALDGQELQKDDLEEVRVVLPVVAP